jgi:hypothetical protein
LRISHLGKGIRRQHPGSDDEYVPMKYSFHKVGLRMHDGSHYILVRWYTYIVRRDARRCNRGRS